MQATLQEAAATSQQASELSQAKEKVHTHTHTHTSDCSGFCLECVKWTTLHTPSHASSQHGFIVACGLHHTHKKAELNGLVSISVVRTDMAL